MDHNAVNDERCHPLHILASLKTSCVDTWRTIIGQVEVTPVEEKWNTSWGSSALMQVDMAPTEAACPPSKSNYDNHASGKAADDWTGREPLIWLASYLNHSSPPPRMPSSVNVNWLLKRRPANWPADSWGLVCLFPPFKTALLSPPLPPHQR